MSRSSKVTDANNEKSENPVYRVYDSDNPAFERSQSIHSIQSNKSKKSKKKSKQPDAVSIGKLFSLATRGDVAMIIIALIMSLGTGICWPLIILVFGTTASSMADYQYYVYSLTAFLTSKNIPNLSTMTVTDMETIAVTFNFTTKFPNFIFNTMSTMSQYFAAIALGMFLLSYISVTFLVITSQHQISVMRNAFFTALMRQNIGWFDEQTSGALNNKLIDDINTVHAGIGDKIGQMVLWFSCCIAGIILAFVNGWKLTLVILSISPLIVICMIMLAKFMMTLTQKVSEAYGKAGGIAEEVLGAVRTVVSFRGEKYEVNRYTDNLDDACKTGIRKSILTGTLLGLVQGLLFASYALGFWYGANLIRTEVNFTVGNMLIIFFSSLMATMGLGNATPHLGSLNESRKAVAGIYNIIDRVPEIDKMSKTGKKLEDFRGKITFENAVFNYPTRTDVPVLTGLSLSIEPGQTVALVGASGCGKSSLIQLIQRFYDVNNGEVLIDDVNIKDFNVLWLREQIGVVSQEPVLFGCTIKENIQYGRMDVTDEEIDNALVMANAKTFVESLPNKLDTLVGDRGTQLSGGQKQRIAIARALVRNPKILLLDEATSALDSESEKIVQDALDKVVEGRTTIIVAHRLSTVRNANIIFGIKDGKVLEKGTHEELINLNGLYKELVDRQKIDQEKEENLNGTDIKETSELSPTKSLTRKKSIVEKAEEIKEELKEDAKKNSAGVLRVLKLNQPEMGYIFLGCISSIFNGAVQPSFSILFGYLLPAMANPDLKKQESEITIYVIALAGLAVVVFVSSVLLNVGFGKSGENLTKRCRSITFEAMLRQDISWFDDPKNNIGALTTRLSDEASQIRGISGENFGSILTAVCSLGAAVIISFAFCWQISLVVLAFVPIIFVGGILQIRITQGFSKADKGSLEESGKIAVECIENVRTVSNLTREQTFIQHYKEAIGRLDGEVSKKAHIQGLLFGITQAAIFCAYAATFILAGYLLQNNKTEMKNVFISFGALIFGAMNLGKSMAMAPNFGKGKQAAANMFELLDRVPPINSSSSDGTVLDILNTNSCIDIENVKFSYPLRPNIVILNNVSFNIKPNKTVALVGPSGCGKSTIIGLLQRFYDIQEGNIKIDNNKITDINIKNLRQLFSIVSQEPTLFSYSIRENIAYSDMENIFTDDQIIEAAKAANIHDFISNLPDKYDTKVGEKGSNFSGGQKQRIAIARALLRNPKVLLLDEATSALDTESEKVVQEALDKAQEGRTCVVIAHRLSTIQNSDKIIVFKEGKIVESGTHFELLSKNGVYTQMINLQSHK